jgi:hypothetical protein
MNRNWWFAGILGLLLCSTGAETSQANTLYVSFACGASCGDISATDLAFAVNGSSGNYTATEITGNVNVGISNADDDNVNAGSYAVSLLGVGTIGSNDNTLLYPNTPYLTPDGFAFRLAGYPSYDFEVYSGGGSLYDLFIFANTESRYGMSSFSVSDTATATPLPSTWCMLLGGLVGLGGLIAFRSSKKRGTALATA